MSEKFNAYWVTESSSGFKSQIIEREIDDLPNHDTLIKVHYSSLNYKDALSISGHKGITRNYPHQPGIDAAGEVVSCKSGKFKQGDKVICAGYDLGMNTAGGYGEFIRVPAEWVVPLPENMSLENAMAYGTAGFTAALGLWLLERNGQQPNQGPVVVTGATGGVGSLAVAILAKAGYEVFASTGKVADKTELLKDLGASEVVDRTFVNQKTDKLLLRPQWAGAIDTVGGNTLHTLLKACKPYGNIACCGLVESANLDISVYPFIINGISLLGIATAENPIQQKKEIWKLLANAWSISQLNNLKQIIELNELASVTEKMLKGQTTGRVVVKHNTA